MRCDVLPATGAGLAMSAFVVAVVLIVTGGLMFAVTRRRLGPSLVVVIAIGTMAITSNPAAAATDDCPPETTVAATSTSTTAAPDTTTPEEVTTSTAVAPVVVSYCGTLTIGDQGEFQLDTAIEMVDGVGTFRQYPGGSDCSGELLNSGPVVDSDFVGDPDDYCATNHPGTSAAQGASAGSWDPPLPDTWYGCVPTDPEPVVVSYCGTLTITDENGRDFELDTAIEMVDGVGTFRQYSGGSDCSGELFNSGSVVDSNFVGDPDDYCASSYPGSSAAQGASAGSWNPPLPDTWYGCVPTDPEPVVVVRTEPDPAIRTEPDPATRTGLDPVTTTEPDPVTTTEPEPTTTTEPESAATTEP